MGSGLSKVISDTLSSFSPGTGPPAPNSSADMQPSSATACKPSAVTASGLKPVVDDSGRVIRGEKRMHVGVCNTDDSNSPFLCSGNLTRGNGSRRPC